jgi:carbonic anhydrase
VHLLQEVNTDIVYNYKGSFTTPLCEEEVEWIILDDPQPISEK